MREECRELKVKVKEKLRKWKEQGGSRELEVNEEEV